MSRPPQTRADIAASIRALAEHCLDVATDADYYGGFDADMQRTARVLIAGSAVLVVMAEGMEK